MSRIIINNHTDATDERALNLVLGVVKQGRISANGAEYCYMTKVTYPSTGERFLVGASRTDAGADSFSVHRVEGEESK